RYAPQETQCQYRAPEHPTRRVSRPAHRHVLSGYLWRTPLPTWPSHGLCRSPAERKSRCRDSSTGWLDPQGNPTRPHVRGRDYPARSHIDGPPDPAGYLTEFRVRTAARPRYPTLGPPTRSRTYQTIGRGTSRHLCLRP